METRRSLARRLGSLSGFENPSVDLEQYHTPAGIAATLAHVAALQNDLDRAPVVDLGTGTGMLAIACALADADTVIGLELDRRALSTAQHNARTAGVSDSITWIQGDARQHPLSTEGTTTVVMNPPFGAQNGRAGADREFLESARRIASVSYSIHNAGSQSFIEAYVDDHGGTITHAFAVELDLDRQFPFHDRERKTIDAEAYRIEWSQPS